MGCGVTETAQIAQVTRNTVYTWFESGGITGWQLQLLHARGFDAAYIVTGVRGVGASAALPKFDMSSEDVAFQMGRPNSEALAYELAERQAKYGVQLSVEEAVDLVRNGVYVWVPFYDLKLSGGAGAEFFETPSKWNFYRRDYIESRGLNPADLCEMSVVGTSMWPELQGKDTTMLDRASTRIDGGDIYALRVGSTLYVKFLQELPNGDVMVSSKQALEYPSFIVPAADFESKHAEVIGRVCRNARDR